MQKNELVTVTIEDIGVNGEGIGRVNGYTLFIKDAVIGDVVEAKITKTKKNYGYARMMQIITPSVYRVEPVCEFARKCGGCQIQEMSYERQLEFKQDKVLGNLERIGGFSKELLKGVFDPIIGMETPFRYRNKAQFPFGTDKDGNPITGFYAGRTHDIISNTDCALGVSVNRDILEIVLAFMKQYQIPSYNEKTGEGLIRHVLIRYGFVTKEIMVCLVLNQEKRMREEGRPCKKANQDKAIVCGRWIPHQEVLLEQLKKIQGMISISVCPNIRRTNVIMGERYEVLWGQPFITDYIGEVKYQISPLSFYQVNPVQTEKLYGLALKYADLKGQETVWDLYCGIGTISLFLAQKAGKVYGVEIVPQAVEDARQNARINGIENAEFYVGKAEEVLPEYYAKYKEEHPGERACADVIVVDPPRKGCDAALLKTMVDMQPERIVYVSCDSATLARDLKYLCESGYVVKKGRAVDQFPMSGHTETVVKLSLKTGTPKIEVTMRPNEESNYVPAEKATYQNIKDYVLKEFDLKVHSLYIAQIKDKCGLNKERTGNHWAKNENARVPKCTPEKEAAIMDAFRHFGMV